MTPMNGFCKTFVCLKQNGHLKLQVETGSIEDMADILN